MAHHIIMLALQGAGPALNFRVQILAVAANVQQPGHVINTRDMKLHVLDWHIHAFQQRFSADLNAVAKSDRFHLRMTQHSAGYRGHRIGVVE